jgi:hypothetical protein
MTRADQPATLSRRDGGTMGAHLSRGNADPRWGFPEAVDLSRDRTLPMCLVA